MNLLLHKFGAHSNAGKLLRLMAPYGDLALGITVIFCFMAELLLLPLFNDIPYSWRWNIPQGWNHRDFQPKWPRIRSHWSSEMVLQRKPEFADPFFARGSRWAHGIESGDAENILLPAIWPLGQWASGGLGSSSDPLSGLMLVQLIDGGSDWYDAKSSHQWVNDNGIPMFLLGPGNPGNRRDTGRPSTQRRVQLKALSNSWWSYMLTQGKEDHWQSLHVSYSSLRADRGGSNWSTPFSLGPFRSMTISAYGTSLWNGCRLNTPLLQIVFAVSL